MVKMTWSHPKMPFPQRVRLLLGSLSPSKFGDKISSFAYPGCLSQIPDPESEFFPSQIPDSGSKFFPSRILDPGSASKNLSILTKKNSFSALRNMAGFSIPDPDSVSQIPNLGVKKAPEPWSRIPDPQHWRFWLCSGCRGYCWLLTFNRRCCLNN